VACSIVPKLNEYKDRDVYLVLDTFGEMGWPGARPTKRILSARRWFAIC
jgi:hypothetical protein